MFMPRVVTIVHTIKLFGDMHSASRAGWVKPSEIVNWSGVSQSAVYRYLPQIEQLGFIKSETYKCRKIECKRYHITYEGIEFLRTPDDIPF